RLREAMNHASRTHEQQIRLLKRQIGNLLTNIKRSIPMKDASCYIAVGGEVRFVGKVLPGTARDGAPCVVSRDAFAEFADSVARLTVEALVQKYSLSYLDAETLTPALLAVLQLLKETQSPNVIISG